MRPPIWNNPKRPQLRRPIHQVRQMLGRRIKKELARPRHVPPTCELGAEREIWATEAKSEGFDLVHRDREIVESAHWEVLRPAFARVNCAGDILHDLETALGFPVLECGGQ